VSDLTPELTALNSVVFPEPDTIVVFG
jgi:hypothetical protein